MNCDWHSKDISNKAIVSSALLVCDIPIQKKKLLSMGSYGIITEGCKRIQEKIKLQIVNTSWRRKRIRNNSRPTV